MNKGDILELKITSIGKDGEGVARLDNFVIFVPGTLLDEVVKVQITLVKKSFAQAKVIKIIESSPYRVQPKCPIYFRCGGCDLQHIDYEYQLKLKKENIKSIIKKNAGLDVEVDDVFYDGNIFGYRNKVQIPIRTIDGVAKAGFYKSNSHIFVPFEKTEDKCFGDCLLHTRKMQDILDAFLKFVNDNKIETYKEEIHKGLIRHLVLRRVGLTYSICVVINGDKIPNIDKLIDILKTLDIEFSLYTSKNKDKTNVILGNTVLCVYGQDKVKGEALGVKYSVNPKSFLQVNDNIRDAIYSKVVDVIKNTKDAYIADLYSGIGILSNIMAPYAKKVYGIEIVKEAVEDANKLAIENGNHNIQNICGDVLVELPKLVKEFKQENSIVVIDPPRKGCDEKVLKTIIDVNPKNIIYISCNPATLARDLNILKDYYNIESVSPYEMFANTKAIECLVKMSAKNQ